jgi:hypothetical protein
MRRTDAGDPGRPGRDCLWLVPADITLPPPDQEQGLSLPSQGSFPQPTGVLRASQSGRLGGYPDRAQHLRHLRWNLPDRPWGSPKRAPVRARRVANDVSVGGRVGDAISRIRGGNPSRSARRPNERPRIAGSERPRCPPPRRRFHPTESSGPTSAWSTDTARQRGPSCSGRHERIIPRLSRVRIDSRLFADVRAPRLTSQNGSEAFALVRQNRLPKLRTRVRFSSPALHKGPGQSR